MKFQPATVSMSELHQVAARERPLLAQQFKLDGEGQHFEEEEKDARGSADWVLSWTSGPCRVSKQLPSEQKVRMLAFRQLRARSLRHWTSLLLCAFS